MWLGMEETIDQLNERDLRFEIFNDIYISGDTDQFKAWTNILVSCFFVLFTAI